LYRFERNQYSTSFTTGSASITYRTLPAGAGPLGALRNLSPAAVFLTSAFSVFAKPSFNLVSRSSKSAVLSSLT
jgi:hypothetical protein